MAFDFSSFEDEGLNEAFVDWLVDEQWIDIGSHFGRFWDYYQNPKYEIGAAGKLNEKLNESSRNYIQGQEYGLPARITGVNQFGAGGVLSGSSIAEIRRKEVVIENDIAWRVNAMVDFLFGKGVKIVSKAPDVDKRREIEEILKTVFETNGGVGFFQDMAVLGSVYGFVDCIVRPGLEVLVKKSHSNAVSSKTGHFRNSLQGSSLASILSSASSIGLELIEAPRALPILEEDDYRKIKYYVQNFYQQKTVLVKGVVFLAAY